MKKNILPLSCLIIFGFLFPNSLYSQTKLETIELNIQRSIRKLNNKINLLENKDTRLVRNLNLLSKSATLLFQKISNDGIIGQLEDTLFINSLEQSQQLLDQLILNWSSQEDAADIMESIKIDYDLKIRSSSLGVYSGIITNIEVTVITKHDNQDISGYDVFYTYMWDSQSKKKKQYFTNQTNNAKKILSPGYYFFWIEKNGILIQNKPKIEIGNLMLSKETIIFNL